MGDTNMENKIAGMIAYLRHQYDNGAPMPMFLSMIGALEETPLRKPFGSIRTIEISSAMATERSRILLRIFFKSITFRCLGGNDRKNLLLPRKSVLY
jgi:hypothetical protein